MSSKPSKEEVKKLFRKFDNGNGHLSLAEIDKAIISYYPNIAKNKKAIMRAYKTADASGNGFVELKEFEKIVEFIQEFSTFQQLFDQLDTNDDHQISYREFKKGFDLAGEDDADEEYIRREFDQIDTDKSGQISFEDFCCYMTSRKVH